MWKRYGGFIYLCSVLFTNYENFSSPNLHRTQKNKSKNRRKILNQNRSTLWVRSGSYLDLSVGDSFVPAYDNVFVSIFLKTNEWYGFF